MLNRKITALTCLVLIGFGLLAGCDLLPQPPAAAALARTPTPTATMDPLGYQSIAPQSCQIANWSTIQSEQRQGGLTLWLQGDLLSWQPGSAPRSGWLAYLAPDERSSWFTGRLMLAKGPDFMERVALAPNVFAAGDLTWSPDGERLAFLTFRPSENVYSVMTVRADGSGLADLFPTDLARTDISTSRKAIAGWKDNRTVQVIASCGEQCRNIYDIPASGPSGEQLSPTPVSDYHVLPRNLEISRHVLEYVVEDFPRGFRATPPPDWSPDERQVVYLDRRGLLWLLLPDRKNHYLVDVGLRDVQETQWLDDGSKLAVRAEDRIYVFETPCQKE